MTEMQYSDTTRTLTVKLVGELDHHTVRRVREDVDRRLFELAPDALTLDFSGVEFMDSSGLGLILGRAECVSGLGGRLVLCGLSPRVRRLLMLSGIEKLRCVCVL